MKHIKVARKNFNINIKEGNTVEISGNVEIASWEGESDFVCLAFGVHDVCKMWKGRVLDVYFH